MFDRSMVFLAAAMAACGAQAQGVASASIDVSARPLFENRLPACRLTGAVVPWVSRPVAVLDDMRASLGVVEAGLAQFADGSTLQGCVPDGATLSLSGQFVNFVVADDRSVGRRELAGWASRLAQDFYQLAELEGTIIPLVDGIKLRAIGSVSYRFRVVLICDGKPGPVDAVIIRETLGTKFAARLSESDRRQSTRKWSSVPQVDSSAATVAAPAIDTRWGVRP